MLKIPVLALKACKNTNDGYGFGQQDQATEPCNFSTKRQASYCYNECKKERRLIIASD